MVPRLALGEALERLFIGAAADVVLRAAPGVSTTVRAAAAEGQASLETTEAEGIVPGAMLELHCAGRTSTTPAGKSHTQPFIGVKVTSVSGAGASGLCIFEVRYINDDIKRVLKGL